MHISTLGTNTGLLSFPALKKVTERLNLTKDNVTDFDFPQLTEVKRLEIGGSSWARNTTITNLNGLANLEKIGSLSIQYCESLVDYSGLKKAFDSGSITPEMWTDNNIKGNAYNPTYENLASGNWIMP